MWKSSTGNSTCELLVEVVDRERAVDPDAPLVDLLDRLVRQVELVLDLADDLLEQVLERDDALHRAVLVDDDRHVLVLRRNSVRSAARSFVSGTMYAGRRIRVEHDGRDAVVVHRGEEVAHVEDADDVVERLAVDRVARVRRVDHRAQHVLGRHVDRDRHDLGPRHHHVRGLLVGEVEDLVEHLPLVVLEDARLRRSGNDQAEVRLTVRDHAGGRGVDAERAREEVRRLLESPDQRVCGDVERLDRERNPERRRLVLAQRKSLRHKLAQGHVQIGDDHEGDDECDPRGEDRIEEVLDERFADCAECDREDGDAELHRADEAHGAVHDPKGDPGPKAAGDRKLVQARAARGDERVLGGDEKRVPEDDQEHEDDAKEVAHAPLSGAWVLGGRSSSNAVIAAQYR